MKRLKRYADVVVIVIAIAWCVVGVAMVLFGAGCDVAALSGAMPSVPGQSGSRPGQYVFLGMAPLSAGGV
jgi:hypothetical protein